MTKIVAERQKLLRDVLGLEEATRHFQFKEEERQKGKQATLAAQLVGDVQDEPRGKPNVFL